jgi:hypothetical protein
LPTAGNSRVSQSPVTWGAPTLAEFEKLVSEHEILYFVSSGSGSGAGGPVGSSGSGSQITAWVKAHFTANTVGGMTVYDLTTSA